MIELKDVGSIEYFQDILEWALTLTSSIIQFCQLFKNSVILSGNFEIPKSVIRSLPNVELNAENFANRVFRIARSHSVVIECNELIVTDSLSSWDKELIRDILLFSTYHQKVMKTPLDLSLLKNEEINTKRNNQEYSNGDIEYDMTGLEEDSNRSDSDSLPEFNAIISNKEKSNGWGLYPSDERAEDDDDDDSNSSDDYYSDDNDEY
jgi:hypothetical protein